MISKQYCSVCKQWLDMKAVSSGDPEEDDGVTWFQCPGCQGFLPKLMTSVEDDESSPAEASASEPTPDLPDATPAPKPSGEGEGQGDGMPWDSPGEMIAEVKETSQARVDETLAGINPDVPGLNDDDLVGIKADSEAEATGDSPAGLTDKEPIAEYAAMLEAVDPELAVPYRPWVTYQVGQCIVHLAWDDCGVVVAKEPLPGGRQVIKCFFSQAGVVRLIENAPR